MEWLVWRINLALFFLAWLVFIGMLFASPSAYLLLPLLVMFATFLAGGLFSLNLPYARWQEFNHTLNHGEVLVIVDSQVYSPEGLDNRIHSGHPEAITCRVCWTA